MHVRKLSPDEYDTYIRTGSEYGIDVPVRTLAAFKLLGGIIFVASGAGVVYVIWKGASWLWKIL